MNLIQTYKAVEEGNQRGFSWRLLEYHFAFLVVPILVVTFSWVIDIEATNLREALLAKAQNSAYSSS